MNYGLQGWIGLAWDILMCISWKCATIRICASLTRRGKKEKSRRIKITGLYAAAERYKTEREQLSLRTQESILLFGSCLHEKLSAIGRCSFLVLQLFVLAEQWSLRGMNVSASYFLKTKKLMIQNIILDSLCIWLFNCSKNQEILMSGCYVSCWQNNHSN